MKKIILVLILLISGIVSINAQNMSNNALGVRFGDNDSFGGEISYQKKLGVRTRFELDLGFRDYVKTDAFKLTGVFQWVFFIDNGFNWYAGVGAGIGSWSNKNSQEPNNDPGVFINADGNIGIEYDFNAPILISLDFRPEIGVIGTYGKDSDLDLAMSIRFQF